MRIFPFIAFVMLAVVLVAMLLQKGSLPPLGAQRNESMPALSVTTLDSKAPWKPEALLGHVTLVNFFASWCTPCESEMPEFSALKKDFPALHLEGVVWNDNPDTIRKWLVTHGDPFGKLWYDKDGSATISLGIRGIPESFLIDHRGVIRYRLSGPLTQPLRAQEFDALVKTLLDEAHHAK